MKRFLIWGRHIRGGVELIDDAEMLALAQDLLLEYALAYGAGWALWVEERDAAASQDEIVTAENPQGAQ